MSETIAIIIRPENEEKMAATCGSLSPQEVHQMTEEYSTHPNGPIFFVLRWNELKEEWMHWGTYPLRPFEAVYEYDGDKIKTNFVEVTPRIG